MMEFQLTLSSLDSLVSEEEFRIGQLFYETGKVQDVERYVEVGNARVTAVVRGKQVMVGFRIGNDGVEFHCFCTEHPSEYSCPEVAALLLEIASDSEDPLHVSDRVADPYGWQRNVVPQWERNLNRLLPVADEDPEIVEEPLGLILKVVSEPRYGGDDVLSLQARPAKQGSKSPWVQTGVSWKTVAFDERFPRAQRRAVVELNRLREHAEKVKYGHFWETTDWISLMELPGKDLLAALKDLKEAGVAIINGGVASKPPVNFSDKLAHAHVDLRQGEHGLTVEGMLRGPEPEHTHLLPIGNPPTLVAYSSQPLAGSRDLGLAEFADPVSAELGAFIASGVQFIPSSDVGRFEETHLDRIRQLAPLKSADVSYEIPEPPRPVLRLRMSSTTDGVGLHFSWMYSAKAPRQRNVEKEIIASINDKLGDATVLGQLEARGTYADRELTIDESIDFMLYILPLLEEHPDMLIEAHNQLPEYRILDSPATVSIEAGENTGDWFDLTVEVTIDDIKVPFALLLAALTLHLDYLVLEDMTVIPISGADFAQLRTLIDEAGELGKVEGSTIRVHKLSIDWWQELLDLGIIEAQHNQWLQNMNELTRGEELQQVELPETFKANLRPYQEQGLAWLNFLRTHSLGGVLADDMGLGKTVQLLACLEQARRENPDQKFLVLAPTSVVGNWINEARRFTPNLKTRGITSTTKKAGQTVADQLGDAQLVVTSYTIFRLAYEEFEAAGFSVMIMDEAQQLKNHVSKGYKQARQLPVPCKFVVTGTPMENNLMELWALVSLAAPGLLGGQNAFKDNYQKLISEGDKERLDRLKSRLRPFVLRRTKEQVVPELPAKTEQILEVELEANHRKAYDRRFQRVRQEVLGLVDNVDSNRFKILQSLTLLRQLALDPSLVGEGDGASAKLELLRELMVDAVAEGHKILVFSQFTSFLSKAKDIAVELGIAHGYLDGSTSGAKRKELIEGFTDGDFPVFFISLKSGGFGINLTAADYCILLDPWWNPAAEAQAIDRAHRIGQEKPVHVYRLVAKDTIESKVLALQAKKTQLFNDVLGDEAQAGQSPALSADDFLALME
ncbi:DEAD/DEAH box helicase [Glutamicibacter sp. JL.03c]|uniref:DEAD/DEAH box helicase n=1 Tax=Glutamicibacter sp. JL.03c TaxID=2984842 RepID=UPI0021F75886|nr:DEAD/DEAH box helicase [Glutamicibacter sp. JL.03c]UYQ77004.1 DEAD/DEAH box helicase [Glutamicibacter sp. JL.03c]